MFFTREVSIEVFRLFLDNGMTYLSENPDDTPLLHRILVNCAELLDSIKWFILNGSQWDDRIAQKLSENGVKELYEFVDAVRLR